MEFRIVVLIALWTFLSGPVFAPPPAASSRAKIHVVKSNGKAASTPVAATAD